MTNHKNSTCHLLNIKGKHFVGVSRLHMVLTVEGRLIMLKNEYIKFIYIFAGNRMYLTWRRLNQSYSSTYKIKNKPLYEYMYVACQIILDGNLFLAQCLNLIASHDNHWLILCLSDVFRNSQTYRRIDEHFAKQRWSKKKKKERIGNFYAMAIHGSQQIHFHYYLPISMNSWGIQQSRFPLPSSEIFSFYTDCHPRLKSPIYPPFLPIGVGEKRRIHAFSQGIYAKVKAIR